MSLYKDAECSQPVHSLPRTSCIENLPFWKSRFNIERMFEGLRRLTTTATDHMRSDVAGCCLKRTVHVPSCPIMTFVFKIRL